MVEHRKSLPQAVPSSICGRIKVSQMNPPKSRETSSLGKLQEMVSLSKRSASLKQEIGNHLANYKMEKI